MESPCQLTNDVVTNAGLFITPEGTALDLRILQKLIDWNSLAGIRGGGGARCGYFERLENLSLWALRLR